MIKPLGHGVFYSDGMYPVKTLTGEPCFTRISAQEAYDMGARGKEVEEGLKREKELDDWWKKPGGLEKIKEKYGWY